MRMVCIAQFCICNKGPQCFVYKCSSNFLIICFTLKMPSCEWALLRRCAEEISLMTRVINLEYHGCHTVTPQNHSRSNAVR